MFSRMGTIALALALVGAGAHLVSAAPVKFTYGAPQLLGKGSVRTYAAQRPDGKVTAIGVVFKAGMLDGLPPDSNRTSRCFDLDKNGRINDHGECEGDYELRLSLPRALAGRNDIPIRWVAVNWNPHGHPPEAWSVPHFDFHFYMVDKAAIDAIRVGPCPIFIDCDDKKRALAMVPAKYVAPDHASVGAAVSKMGDHLIDTKSPELAPKGAAPFTHTFIYGAYDGHITFLEPMITRAYLQSRPKNGCSRIKQPKARERAGLYPTMYCIRHSTQHGTYTVSLEGMVYRSGQ